jgi:hypothetical protein
MEEPAGSIRNSHRDINPVRKKNAPKRVAEQARALVDGCSASGPIIRQHLDMERMKQPLQKGVFYVIENEAKAEPGFLVFLPGQAPVFLQTKVRADPPCTLRMRVSTVLGEGGGSILVASLDRVHHTLRLEDVWMWCGNSVYDSVPYSKRRGYLKEFVERHWIPDTRLMGGISTFVLNPRSLQEFLDNPQYPVTTVEFIPEMPGKRRMWISPEEGQAPAAALIAAAPAAAAPTPAPRMAPQTHTKATARVVDKMPDIYDLYDETGAPIGRGSVQKFALSQLLRTRDIKAGVPVRIRWVEDFKGYEIVETLDNSP